MMKIIVYTCLVLFFFSVNSFSEIAELKLQDVIDTLAEQVPSKNSVKKTDNTKTIISVKVEGNNTISVARILEFSLLKVGDELNPYKIRRSVKAIKGLGVFKSVLSKIDKDKGGAPQLTFIVEENPLIEAIEFEGNSVYSDAELSEVISAKKGTLLSLNDIRSDIQQILKHYKDNDYTLATVFQVSTPEKAGDPLVFKIAEGVIEAIFVTGNIKTQNYVILREMQTKEGQPLQQTILYEDIRRVYNLNFFDGIEPLIQEGLVAGSKIITLQLAEKKTNGSVSFGGGFSQRQGFSIFSDLYWDNLFGTGQLGMLKGQFNLGGTDTSGRSSSYQFKYHNPWMWDERKSLTLRTWLTDGQLDMTNIISSQMTGQNTALVEARKKGMDVTIGFPLTYELKTFHTLKDEVTVLPKELVSLNNNYYQATKYKEHSYKFMVSLDTRDVWFNPTKGVYNTFSVEKSFVLYQDSIDYIQYDLGIKAFVPVMDKQVLAFRFDLGLFDNHSEIDQNIQLSKYYRVGGANTVRGYGEEGYSYGNKMALFSIEYRFLFNDTFQLVFFSDAGYASTSSLSDLTNYKVGKGVGVRVNVPPLGPLRLDFGWDENGAMRTHFSIGHTF